jgi:uncharacterized protein (TIGR03435 family)
MVGDRNTTMPLLAEAIYSYGALAGEVDKPVVDKTGLNGTFDFTIEFMLGENDLSGARVRVHPKRMPGRRIRKEPRF